MRYASGVLREPGPLFDADLFHAIISLPYARYLYARHDRWRCWQLLVARLLPRRACAAKVRSDMRATCSARYYVDATLLPFSYATGELLLITLYSFMFIDIGTGRCRCRCLYAMPLFTFDAILRCHTPVLPLFFLHADATAIAAAAIAAISLIAE